MGHNERIATLLAIAIKSAEGGPMIELPSAEVETGGGVVGNTPAAPHRGVTFLSSPQWDEVNRELADSLPWHTRRANFLLDAPRLGPYIGRRFRIGEALIEIGGETKPCKMMEGLRAGLLRALAPDCRGGVFGRVMEGGVLRPGAHVTLE